MPVLTPHPKLRHGPVGAPHHRLLPQELRGAQGQGCGVLRGAEPSSPTGPTAASATRSATGAALPSQRQRPRRSPTRSRRGGPRASRTPSGSDLIHCASGTTTSADTRTSLSEAWSSYGIVAVAKKCRSGRRPSLRRSAFGGGVRCAGLGEGGRTPHRWRAGTHGDGERRSRPERWHAPSRRVRRLWCRTRVPQRWRRSGTTPPVRRRPMRSA
jgi:hypothetical protein